MQVELFGILNMTTDSFSDGGQFLNPEVALKHAEHLLQSGADVLDIGASSSHPDSAAVAPETEIARLESVVAHLQSKGAAVSIDSYFPETQLWACRQNVAWLNDVHGFGTAEIYPALAKSTCRLCVMHSIQAPHSIQTPSSIQTPNVAVSKAISKDSLWQHMTDFFDTRLAALEAAGIARDRLVLDPGMGLFLGDTFEVSLWALALLARLKEKYALPVLVSVSRKSFLRTLSGRTIPEIGAMTLAAELYAAAQGVDYIRTHDVAQLKDALDLTAAIDGAIDTP